MPDSDSDAVLLWRNGMKMSLLCNGMKKSLYVMDMFKNEIDRRRRPPDQYRRTRPAAWQLGTTVGRRCAAAALLLSRRLNRLGWRSGDNILCSGAIVFHFPLRGHVARRGGV